MPLLRLAAEGRGGRYHPVRGILESSLRLAYRGDWPARLWELYPRSCEVRCVEHSLPILPPGAASLRLGFASDLHIGPTTPPKLLEAAFERLAGAELDVLLLGGDYVFLDATTRTAAALTSLARSVPARHKFAVLGNHDLWTQHALLESALDRAGVEVLDNRSVMLERRHGALALAGLDDPWTGTPDCTRALAGVPDLDALIVLCHSPDGLPFAIDAVSTLPRAPAALYLCGHTHGGHIATPWGPIIVPGRVGKKYPYGLHYLAPFHLHVSRGVGATELPIRTFATPEVAVFELAPAPPHSPEQRPSTVGPGDAGGSPLCTP